MNKASAIVLLSLVLPGCGLWEKLTGEKDDKAAAIPWKQPAPPPVAPVPQEKLATFIPKLPGWEGSVVGGVSEAGREKFTSARGTFQRVIEGKSQKVTIAIVDGSFSAEVFAPLTRMVHSREGQADAHKKGLELDGNPGIEEWHPETGGVTVALAVARRFFFLLEGEGIPPETLGEWIKGVDLKQLAALAGKPPADVGTAPVH
jgi:hypothetical protein